MSALPRLGVLMIILLACVPPNAAATQCVEVTLYEDFGTGLRVLANAGRSIAVGLVGGELSPGTGVPGAVLIITPSVCGLGAASSQMSPPDVAAISAQTVEETLAQAPSYPPLP